MWRDDDLTPGRRAVLGLALLVGGAAIGRAQSNFLPYLGDVLCIAGICALFQAVKAKLKKK